jgi:hypothetical protein
MNNKRIFNIGDVLYSEMSQLEYVIESIVSNDIRLYRIRHDTDESKIYSVHNINSLINFIKNKEIVHYPVKQQIEYNIAIGDLLYEGRKNNFLLVTNISELGGIVTFQWYNRTQERYDQLKYDIRIVNLWIKEQTMTLYRSNKENNEI